jgi:hypothetical protein
MDDQDPVDRVVGERQLTLISEGDPIGSFRRPAEHAEAGGHQGHGALGLGCNCRQERRGVPDPKKPQSVQIGPYALDRATDHSPRDLTKPGPVKISQVNDIRRQHHPS